MIAPAGVSEFDHVYTSADLSVGRGAVADLDKALDQLGVDRALVVCGSNTGANDDLMEPIRASLGTRLAEVYDGTTPDKDVMGAYGALDRLRAAEADGVVAVGGGSSLDVTKATRLLAAEHRRPDKLQREAERTGSLSAPADATLLPAAVIPTTFAGADLSIGGSVSFPDGARAGMGDRRLMPDVAVYDPDLFETTPDGALVGSAMNGFDKGVESCYAQNANPVIHATAIQGLRYLADGLPECLDDGARRPRPVRHLAAPRDDAWPHPRVRAYAPERRSPARRGPRHRRTPRRERHPPAGPLWARPPRRWAGRGIGPRKRCRGNSAGSGLARPAESTPGRRRPE